MGRTLVSSKPKRNEITLFEKESIRLPFFNKYLSTSIQIQNADSHNQPPNCRFGIQFGLAYQRPSKRQSFPYHKGQLRSLFRSSKEPKGLRCRSETFHRINLIKYSRKQSQKPHMV